MVKKLAELFKTPFLSRSTEEQNGIILEGKPRPALVALASSGFNQGSNEKFTLVFDVASYEHVEWLTGCETRQALFCWPCILFIDPTEDDTTDDLWHSAGLKNLLYLRGEIMRHAKTILHIQSTLKLKTMSGDLKSVVSSNPAAVKEDSREKNIKLVRRFIDVVCFAIFQKLPERITDHENIVKTEDCVHFLNLHRSYDIGNDKLIDDATEMLKTNLSVLNDIVKSIVGVMEMSLQKEMEASTYVSVIVSEHSEDPEKSQVSLVLRYLKDGEVCERFVGFANSVVKFPCISGPFIFEFINQTIQKFKISKKVLAFSFDESPALQNVKGLRAMKNLSKNACSVPSYFYKFENMLQQSLCVYEDCDRFFKHMQTLRVCFEYGSKMWQEWQSYLQEKLYSMSTPVLDASASYVEYLKCVKNYRIYLLPFLDYKMANHENVFDADFAEARGLRTFLKDLGSVFLIETFIRLFRLVLPLSGNSALDSTFDTDLIVSVHISLRSEWKEAVFNNLWNTTVEQYKDLIKPRIINTELKDRKSFYSKLYFHIMKVMNQRIKNRFNVAKECIFVNMLNFRKNNPSRKTDYLKKLMSSYGKVFSAACLRDEILSLEKKEDILKCETVHELQELFLSRGLIQSYPNVHKLLELVLTLPHTLPSSDEYLSKWPDIKTWSYSPEKDKVIDNMSLLCIERLHLKTLRRKACFYDEVMTQLKNRNNILM